MRARLALLLSTYGLVPTVFGKEDTELAESELLERLRARRALPVAVARRQIRLAAGASLRDVAREVGVSATSVIRWESGSSPGIHTAAYARLLEEFQRLAT